MKKREVSFTAVGACDLAMGLVSLFARALVMGARWARTCWKRLMIEDVSYVISGMHEKQLLRDRWRLRIE